MSHLGQSDPISMANSRSLIGNCDGNKFYLLVSRVSLSWDWDNKTRGYCDVTWPPGRTSGTKHWPQISLSEISQKKQLGTRQATCVSITKSTDIVINLFYLTTTKNLVGRREIYLQKSIVARDGRLDFNMGQIGPQIGRMRGFFRSDFSACRPNETELKTRFLPVGFQESSRIWFPNLAVWTNILIHYFVVYFMGFKLLHI